MALNTFSHNYDVVYENEVKYAIDYYKSYSTQFEKASKKSNYSSDFLFSIVAPEVSQFNNISNIAETYSLKVFYTQLGSSYSNFSIGHFQMKPSFIEEIEKSIEKNAALHKKHKDILIKETDKIKQRIERLNRIESFDWQLKYLIAFVDIVDLEYKEHKLSIEERLKLYSTIYNTGLNKEYKTYKDMMDKKFFPSFAFSKYNYSDISLYFFMNLHKI